MPFVIAPELAAIGVAVLLTLLVFGVAYLIRAIGSALDAIPIPVIGNAIASAFNAVATPVVGFLTKVATGLFADVEAMLRGLAWLAVSLWHDAIALFDDLQGSVAYLHGTAIPNAAKAAQSGAASYAAAQSGNVVRELEQARADLQHSVAADQLQEAAKLASAVRSIHAQTLGIAATTLIAARAYADQLYTDGARYTDAQVKGLSDTLGADVAKLGREITGINPGATVTAPTVYDITQGASVATVASLAAAVTALGNEFESCAVTTCDGPNNLTSLLQSLLGGVGLAEAFAFIAELINNPAQAIQDYASVFATLEAGVVGAGGDIVGELESVLGL